VVYFNGLSSNSCLSKCKIKETIYNFAFQIKIINNFRREAAKESKIIGIRGATGRETKLQFQSKLERPQPWREREKSAKKFMYKRYLRNFLLLR
jgi:hypothetical protein